MATSNNDDWQLQTNARKLLSESEDVIERLRAQCLLRGTAGIHGFGRFFRMMDDDGNRKLSREEFRNGCQDYGIRFSQEEFDQLFDRIDKDNTDTIDFEELLIALRPPMSKSRISITKKAFDKMDKTGDGKITLEDMKRVYQARSHPKYQNSDISEETIMRTFLNTFESDGKKDGVVTWEEFLNYYSGVSASVDTDTYFDLMMRNAFKL